MEQTNLNPKKIIGGKLKRAIKKSKWRTQEGFAEAFHTATRNVVRWCNEGIDSIELLWTIADFLEIDVYTLLP